MVGEEGGEGGAMRRDREHGGWDATHRRRAFATHRDKHGWKSKGVDIESVGLRDAKLQRAIRTMTPSLIAAIDAVPSPSRRCATPRSTWALASSGLKRACALNDARHLAFSPLPS